MKRTAVARLNLAQTTAKQRLTAGWFEDLDAESQEKYIQDHPNSKYAKQAKEDRPNPPGATKKYESKPTNNSYLGYLSDEKEIQNYPANKLGYKGPVAYFADYYRKDAPPNFRMNKVRLPAKDSPAEKKAVAKIGGTLHGKWQEEYKKANGPDATRIKVTKDEAWIKANGGKNEVDIANTPFDKLPADWQKENVEAAKAALKSLRIARKHVMSADGNTMPDSQDKQALMLEKAADLIHKEWLSRNGDWAPEDQKLPFKELSKEEADKDRAQARLALHLLGS